MMFLIGIAMMGGYFGLINAVIPLMDAHYPNLSPIFFVIISAAYACTAMKLQTLAERHYISRHVAKNPGSTWRYAGTIAR